MRIGITGGIGSGKSFVCRKISEKGFPVYDCDAEAKKLMCSHPAIRQELIALLGESVYAHEGDVWLLNKPLVANYLFAQPEHAEKINQIVHPRVREHFQHWAQQQTASLCFMESAILFQSHFETEVDEVVWVQSPTRLRLQRTMERDHSTREKVLARMRSQHIDKQMLQGCHIIYNDNTHNLDQQIETLIQQLTTKNS